MKKKLVFSIISILSLYFASSAVVYAEGGVQMKVYVEGEGGTVRDDGGFSCLSGSICLREVPVDSTLNFTAEAADGAVFLGWDSDCGTETSCSLQITEDTVLIAHFSTLSRLERAETSTPTPTLSNAQTATSSSTPSDKEERSGKPSVSGTGELSAVQNTRPEPMPASTLSTASSTPSSSGSSGK